MTAIAGWLRAISAAFLLTFLWLAVASAQNLPKYEVTGFRDARFGMTEPDVRATIVKSFGVKDADIKSGANPVEGTTLLVVRLAALEPGPGPAVVTYIFGTKTKRLIQVNVIWGDDAKVDAETIIGAGTRLARYFAGFAWNKDATRVGIPVGDNTVVLFAGEDEKKGAVRLVIDGIKYQVVQEGDQMKTSPDPKSPPKLVLNYIVDREHPDVATIERGKF